MWLLVRCMQLFLPSVSTVFAQLITNNLTVFIMRYILLWKCFLSTHVHYFVGTSLIVVTSFVYTWHRLDHPASIPTPMIPTTGFTLCFFLKQQSTICIENRKIPGRIQIERFIPVENFRKKSNTFRGITFFPFLPKRPKFSVPFVWITSARLHVERKWKIYRYFVNGTTQSCSCFRCPKKHQYHLTEIFHRNCRTNGKRSWFLSFPKVIRPTALVHCLMTRSSDWDEVFKGIGCSLFFLLFENDSRAL